MRTFKSATQAQRFLTPYGLVETLFRLGRHLMRVANYRLLGDRSFATWQEATIA